MIAYVGRTRARDLLDRLDRLGLGECVTRGELPPRRRPWFYDNGAFRDWKAGRPFDVEAFAADIAELDKLRIVYSITPRFLLLPDIVAGGPESLVFSASWIPRLSGLAPLYLAVQDGMETAPSAVTCYAGRLSGLFVGGTLEWKRQTAPAWVDLAHRNGLRCHIGRVGTARRVRWARSIGADSIDSSLPLWSRPKLERFVNALSTAQRSMPWR